MAPDTRSTDQESAAGRPVWPFPVDDPYPAYERARESGPVHYDDGLGAWVVLSHAGALSVLGADGWSADPRRNPQIRERLEMGMGDAELFSKMLLFTDAPEHDRLRGAVNRFFTPRRVEQIRDRVASIVDSAFADMAAGDEVDVMGEIAYPVPLAVIAELFDVGVDVAHVLREQTPAMTALLDPIAPPEAQEQAASAALSVMLALVPVVADRRKRPGDDLLSTLLERLDTDDAVVMALLLLAAGHETTSGLIANTFVALASHTGRLGRGAASAGDVVEEVLRWDSPVQVTGRVAVRDASLDGRDIRSGDQVVVILGAANRDPSVFSHPERFDPSRPRAGHLAFGHGAHFCVGAALARAEATEVTTHLDSFDWRVTRCERARSSTFRRPSELAISVTRR